MSNAIPLSPIIKMAGLKINPVYEKAFEQGDADGSFEQYELVTKLRVAHFLTQILHESNGLKSVRENMNYSAKRIVQVFGVNRHSAAVTVAEAKKLANNPKALAERVYGLGNPRKSKELGNIFNGDGYDFRGGGPLQTTGRDNYTRAGDVIGIDMAKHPELIERPKYILQPALIFWKSRSLNELADKNDIRGITKRINGGYNGMKDRQIWFNKIWKALDGIDEPSWKQAKPDNTIKKLQRDLNELGADPQLKVDGLFGASTEVAIRKFQQDNGIGVDGIPGTVTKAAIKNRLEAMRSGDTDAIKDRAVDHMTPSTTEIGGGAMVTVGGAGQEIVDKVTEVRDYFPDSGKIQLILTAMLVFGICLILFSMYRKYRAKKNQLIPESD